MRNEAETGPVEPPPPPVDATVPTAEQGVSDVREIADPKENDAGAEGGGRHDDGPVPSFRENGSSVRLVLNDGSTHEVQYQAVEAGSITPSHDARRNFVKNEGAYENERPYHDPIRGSADRIKVDAIASADPDKIGLLTSDTSSPSDGPPIVFSGGQVVGGNGRAMGTQLAYHNGGENAARMKQTPVPEISTNWPAAGLKSTSLF